MPIGKFLDSLTTKLYRQNLDLAGTCSILQGSADPTLVAQSAPAGSIYMMSSGRLFKKMDAGSTTNWLEFITTSTASFDGPTTIENYKVSTSVSSNALTITLLDGTGATASANSPVRAAFRSVTLNNGNYTMRTVTGALSLTIPSTQTLGHKSGVSEVIYVYLVDNSGTVELAVSGRKFFDTTTVQSIAATAAANTSGETLFGAGVRAGVAIRLIAEIDIQNTTAGTWASAGDQIRILNNRIKLPYTGFRATSVTNASLTVDGTARNFTGNSWTIDYDSHTGLASGVYTIPISGKYLVTARMGLYSTAGLTVNNFIQFRLNKNSGTTYYFGDEILVYTPGIATSSNPHMVKLTEILDLAAGDTLQLSYSGSGDNTWKTIADARVNMFSATLLPF